jgi:arylsulfatase A-like enzyme
MVAVLLCLAALNDRGFAQRQVSKPNVLLILADDLGWSDTTLFGTTKFYRTPNIERLAARGMTFTRAYSTSPLCSPTRASVLSGLSPARTGITAPACHLPQARLHATQGASAPPSKKAILPNTATRFDTKYYTLAEALKDNGYATGHFGKWHLGPAPYSPLEQGFDVDVPHWPGPGPAGSYVAPWRFPDFDPNTPDEHIEDRMAQEAVAFMETHRGDPFFLNYWMFSVHAPFDAKQDLIDRYRKRIDPTDPQRSPTYAAMIESMDDAVGTLLDALDRLELADKTIIILASDNGGNMYNEVDGTTPTSNAPLRGGKATMYEGGVRGPAVVVCPGVVKAGSRSDQVIQSSDFYPTLLEVLSIEAQAGQIFDGISIVPALEGNPLNRKAIFTYFPHCPSVPDWLPPSVSVHCGDWKLIRIFHGGESGRHRWKLYNLREDLGEQVDLADQLPARVEELDGMIEAFLAATGPVLPLPNPDFDPAKYRPELEGKGNLKGIRQAPKKASRGKRVARPPVAGWRPEGTCELEIRDGMLVVNSYGGDPHLSYPLPMAVAEETLILHFTMISDSSGSGQIFWHEQGVTPAFFRDRSIAFDVRHDGKSHDYAITFSPKNPVLAVRIDPSTGPGRMQLSNIKLTNAAGAVLQQWSF